VIIISEGLTDDDAAIIRLQEALESAEARSDEREEAIADLMDYTRALEVLLAKHFPDVEPGAAREADLIIGAWKKRAEAERDVLTEALNDIQPPCSFLRWEHCPYQELDECGDSVSIDCWGTYAAQEAQKRIQAGQ
jgi:hypothetical protein